MTDTTTHNAIMLADLADRLSDAYVIEVITGNGVPECHAGRRWFDTRPMLDPREHSGPAIDLCSDALRYAHSRGLISAHPQQPHLVRIARAVAS